MGYFNGVNRMEQKRIVVKIGSSSLTNAKNDCNGDISSISKCCNHQYGAKTHKGFIWEWHIA